MENDANFDESDDIEIISKSQLKRESQDILKLGKKLVELKPDQLASLNLDDPVIEAIALAHKIQNKRSALKRHFQFLAKLLRARDTEAIFTAMGQFDKTSQIQIQRHHQAERWRDQIIDQGNNAIESFLQEQVQADRQKLRQLWRNYQNAPSEAKKIQHSRLIYKSIKETLDSA